MAIKVEVGDYGSFREALRTFRRLVSEHGVLVGKFWKRRSDSRRFYTPSVELKRQRFYFEKPSVKLRRRRRGRKRYHRRHERQVAIDCTLQWIDANIEEFLTAPDSAWHWVFKMSALDWWLVDHVWSERSPLWRQAFAYLVLDGPVYESRNMLLRAVRDDNDDVAQQAAISLCHQYVQFPNARIKIDAHTVQVIRDLNDRLGESDMTLVREFLDRRAK